MNKEFRTSGQIDENGALHIYNNAALGVFSRKNKGQRVIIEVQVIGKDVTEAMIGYFRKFIIPEFRKALMENGDYKTLEGTEEFLSEICPMLQKQTWCDESKVWITEPVAFEELSIYGGVHCISDLKKTAALEYGFDIDDEQFIND